VRPRHHDPVRARVEVLDGLSAHADRKEILKWLAGFEGPPQKTWLVHGEPEAAAALASTLQQQLGWEVGIAADGEGVILSGPGRGARA
jgi:metallo-beta-lactamase family protein